MFQFCSLDLENKLRHRVEPATASHYHLNFTIGDIDTLHDLRIDVDILGNQHFRVICGPCRSPIEGVGSAAMFTRYQKMRSSVRKGSTKREPVPETFPVALVLRRFMKVHLPRLHRTICRDFQINPDVY